MISTEIITHGGVKIPVYITGDKDDKRKEESHQIELAAWFRYNFPDYIFHHSPNEGEVKPQYRDKQVRMGMHVGFGDALILAIGANGEPYLKIELKRSCKSMSKISKEQKDTMANILKQGKAKACFCYGAKAAKFVICEYFGFTLYPDGYTVCRP